jgi:hypothetical protein
MPQYANEVPVLDVADKVGAHPLRIYRHIRGASGIPNQPSIPTSQLSAPAESGDSALPRNTYIDRRLFGENDLESAGIAWLP